MLSRVAIVYNQPEPSRYDIAGESLAVAGVLEAVTAVHKSLIDLGYTVVEVPLLPPASEIRARLGSLSVDLIFNLFEGFCGFPETEALVPEIAEDIGLPYTGCSATTLRLALDKARTKEVLRAGGIDTPSYQVLGPRSLSSFRLRFPCIVKPVAEDASHGLSEDSVVHDAASLRRQVDLMSQRYGGKALVEEFVDGREFNVTVLGGARPAVLPPSEIVYNLPENKPRVLTFAAKWQPDTEYFTGTSAVCPAPVSEGERERISKIALASFALTAYRGYARVDMRMGGDTLYVLEINPNPDISPGTGAARQAEAAGMDYSRFVVKIMDLALEDKPCQ